MAGLSHRSCMWVLFLSVCVSLVATTDCGKECALCVYQLLEQQSPLSALACSLECDGPLNSQKLSRCQDLLLGDENQIPLEADPHQLEANVVMADSEEAASPNHQLMKKYGGFMKRYGGFMTRRSSTPSAEGALESPDDNEVVGLQLLKLLSEAAEHGSDGDSRVHQAVKRYGGFMRQAESSVEQSDLLEAVLDRGLKKRYGGFMRRVGKPEWLVDSKSKRGGLLKQAWKSDIERKKMDEGFMD